MKRTLLALLGSIMAVLGLSSQALAVSAIDTSVTVDAIVTSAGDFFGALWVPISIGLGFAFAFGIAFWIRRMIGKKARL